jgi:DNA-binding response OmpR family regulator
MSQILVIEDQKNLLRSIMQALNEAGYQSLGVDTLESASQLLSSKIDLIVLDLMLPDGQGQEWLKKLRISGSRIPVLILTARDSIEDRVNGLDAGADDYVVKPFVLDELMARIRALLRRGAHEGRALLVYGDLKVDLVARTAQLGSEVLLLQNRQLELLAYFIANANQIVTREMIARDVWKEPTATWTNVIEVQVNQIRKKLEQSGRSALLHTVRGQGYLLGDVP